MIISNRLINQSSEIITPTINTPILDSFSRADAGTIGSNWSPFQNAGSASGDQGIISNQLYNPSSGGSLSNYTFMYWNQSLFGPDCEVYMTINVLAGADNNDDPSLYVRLNDLGPSASAIPFYAYELSYNDAKQFSISVFTQGLKSILIQSASFPLQSGNILCFQAIGSLFRGWVYDGTQWNLVAQATDSTWNRPGYFGFYIPGNPNALNGRYINFGGRTLPYFATYKNSFLHTVGRTNRAALPVGTVVSETEQETSQIIIDKVFQGQKAAV